MSLRKALSHEMLCALGAGEINDDDFTCGLRNHRRQTHLQMRKPVLTSGDDAEFHNSCSRTRFSGSNLPSWLFAFFLRKLKIHCPKTTLQGTLWPVRCGFYKNLAVQTISMLRICELIRKR
jgi:hypothetical protein